MSSLLNFEAPMHLIVLDLHYYQASFHNVVVLPVGPLNVQLEVLDILHPNLYKLTVEPWI